MARRCARHLRRSVHRPPHAVLLGQRGTASHITARTTTSVRMPARTPSATLPRNVSGSHREKAVTRWHVSAVQRAGEPYIAMHNT